MEGKFEQLYESLLKEGQLDILDDEEALRFIKFVTKIKRAEITVSYFSKTGFEVSSSI